jgi:hypothetical protein
VLGAIAALAAITSIAAAAIQEAQVTTRKFERLFQLRAALDSAEQRAVFTFLTASLVQDGISLSADQNSTAEGDVFGDLALKETPEAELWRYNGETLELDFSSPAIRVFAQYQDPEGLVSLNSAGPGQTEFLLKSAGVGPELAASLSARLADYVDADNARRFLGGERAEYRIARLAPPANSPIREWDELGMVMGWEPVLLDKGETLLQMATISPGGTAPRFAAMPKGMQDAYARTSDPPMIARNDMVEANYLASRVPSQSARFTISAISADGVIGLRRVIETERRTATPGPPFSRRLIEERSLSEEEVSGLERDVLSRLPMPASDSSLARRAPD